MGAYLDKPNTKKHTIESKNATLEYTASSMQGNVLNLNLNFDMKNLLTYWYLKISANIKLRMIKHQKYLFHKNISYNYNTFVL